MISDSTITSNDSAVECRRRKMDEVIKPSKSGKYWFQKYKLCDFVDGGRSPDGVDCWGLIWLMYKQELGITLPSYDQISAEDLRLVSGAISRDSVEWPWVEVLQRNMEPFDVVVLRGLGKSQGRYGWYDGHIGIITKPPFIMHISGESGLMHQIIMDTDQHKADELLSRRVRRVARYMDW